MKIELELAAEVLATIWNEHTWYGQNPKSLNQVLLTMLENEAASCVVRATTKEGDPEMARFLEFHGNF